jgi:hypothetical protein
MSKKPYNPFAEIFEDLRLREIERAYYKLLDNLKEFAPLALIGARVKKGARQPRSRKHDLGNLIERTFVSLSSDGFEPTSTDVLGALTEHDAEGIIQEMAEDTIYWIDSQGREHKMRISTARNRVSKIRKSLTSS